PGRLQPEPVGQHARVDLFGAAPARSHRVHAGVVEGARQGDPHRRLHGAERAGARRQGRRPVETAAAGTAPLRPVTIRVMRAVLIIPLAVAALAAHAPQPAPTMNTIAERYVKLVLAVGQHDGDYVDAFYGPDDWKKAAAQQKLPLAGIDASAAQLISEIGQVREASGDELARLRHDYVRRQLEALRARVRMLQGTKLSFDEESQALYDAVAPHHPDSYFADTLKAIERALPGDGPVIDRYDDFRKQFIVPPDRLSHVFDRAIAECRQRTLRHVKLPPDERFTVEYVTGKPWSGYNWYQGNYRSLIQVNTDLPIYIGRAIDLACPEGYPGHHVYNALLEQHLVRDRGWIEFTVYPLFSPQSLIAEGTANYGIEVAFPGDERLAFERDVLFPL